jgi:hypothetical protein
MNRLQAIDNALNNTTCPKMIDKLIYERKSAEINWKAKAIEAKEQLQMLEMEKEAKKGLLGKLKKWIR